MNSCSVSVSFQVPPFETLTYPEEWATDPQQKDNLIRLVRTHYQTDEGDVLAQTQKYENLILSAVQANNLMGIEILCQGIPHFDRANPNYWKYLEKALVSSNLTTVQHLMHDYYDEQQNGNVLVYATLLKLSEKNSDVRVYNFIKYLEPLVQAGCLEIPFEVEDKDSEEPEIVDASLKFYQRVDSFNELLNLATAR